MSAKLRVAAIISLLLVLGSMVLLVAQPGLDPARLGAKAPWRSGARRTVRTQRPGAGTGSRTSLSSSATSREPVTSQGEQEEED